MSDPPPPNLEMTRKFEISNGEKTFAVVVDESGVQVRELGKQPRFKSSWQEIVEFVMQQEFFTFKK